MRLESESCRAGLAGKPRFGQALPEISLPHFRAVDLFVSNQAGEVVERAFAQRSCDVQTRREHVAGCEFCSSILTVSWVSSFESISR